MTDVNRSRSNGVPAPYEPPSPKVGASASPQSEPRVAAVSARRLAETLDAHMDEGGTYDATVVRALIQYILELTEEPPVACADAPGRLDLTALQSAVGAASDYLDTVGSFGDPAEWAGYVEPIVSACPDMFDLHKAGLHGELAPSAGFQARAMDWAETCFGSELPFDKTERNHRFLEEALELVQSTGCTKSEALQLVDYVFGRAVGEPRQEVGGVMVTLATLCAVHDLDMMQDGESELDRIWTKMDQIRAKQAAKPDHSPLPGNIEPASETQ